MFPIITRIFSSLKPRHGRHCAPLASTSPLFPAADMRQRPFAPAPKQATPKAAPKAEPTPRGFSDPAGLAGFRPDPNRSTLRLNVVGDRKPVHPAPPSAQTAVMDAVTAAKFADPSRWYGQDATGDFDWPDVPAAPSLVAASDDPTPLNLRAMRAGLPAAFGHSALTHRTPVAEPWFRFDEESLAAYMTAQLRIQEANAAARDRNLVAFNNRFTARTGKHAPVAAEGVLNTSIFPTVSLPEFASAARQENTR